MGSSKPRFVTAAANKLLKEHGEEFSADFEENKKVIRKYVDSSPSVINKIAGSITVKNKAKKAK